MTLVRTSLLLLALSVVAMTTPRTAVAGPFTDDLSKCLVTKSTPADKVVLVQWIFSVVTLHPSVAEIATVSDAKREAAARKAAALFEVLLTDRCLAEAQQAVKFEGSAAFAASFKVLGEIAATGLFSDPKVGAGSEKMASYIDSAKLDAAFAGVVAPAAPATPAAPAAPAAASAAPTAAPATPAKQ